MSTWKMTFGAALLAAGLAPSAHADEFTKLTLLTFSGPVEVPGISLPAGTYRFELADPTTSRRVIRVSDKDGTKTYGMFISQSNQRMTPTDKPVVMFRESPAGAPPAVQAWFYPGETYGYEFAYPHDQALKIAKATHQPVLAYTDHSNALTSDADRMTSMTNAEVARIDENDRPVSSDEALKESSEPRTPVRTGTTAGNSAQSTTAASGTSGTTAPRATTTAPATTAGRSTRSNTPVATTGSANGAASQAQRPARRHLPRTGSELPLLAMLGSLSLAGAVGARVARKAL